MHQAIHDTSGYPTSRLEPEVVLAKDLALVILGAIGVLVHVAGQVALSLIKGI